MRPGYAYTELCRDALQVALPQAYVTFPEVQSSQLCKMHLPLVKHQRVAGLQAAVPTQSCAVH